MQQEMLHTSCVPIIYLKKIIFCNMANRDYILIFVNTFDHGCMDIITNEKSLITSLENYFIENQIKYEDRKPKVSYTLPLPFSII